MEHFSNDDLEYVLDDYYDVSDFEDENVFSDNVSQQSPASDSPDSDFEDDFETSNAKTDTSASEARNGKDIQGIPWERLNYSREEYRETRLKQYKNYENLSRSREHLDKECLEVQKGKTFYDFQFNTRLVKSTVAHFQNAEASELPSKVVPPPRSSSKRSRAAEFHNLSEKRRSKINEKMKALQNLIPNSNKTDKASMLDEAIEYLKQLQLQVQMLMMRNGFSLHPMSSSGGPRSMMLAETGLNLDETNGFQNSISAIVSSANDESLVRPSYSFPEQCSISNQSIVIPSMTNISTLDASSSFQPSIKDAFCGNMPQLFLDATRMGKLPSPDVS